MFFIREVFFVVEITFFFFSGKKNYKTNSVLGSYDSLSYFPYISMEEEWSWQMAKVRFEQGGRIPVVLKAVVLAWPKVKWWVCQITWVSSIKLFIFLNISHSPNIDLQGIHKKYNS